MLVMEPDYLPIPEIFVSAATYTPGGLHTHEDYTPFRDSEVWGDIVPPWGLRGGQRAPDRGLGAVPPMGVRGQRPQS